MAHVTPNKEPDHEPDKEPAPPPPILPIEPFGVRVRRWRQQIGMSQAELARRLAYSPAYLCDIERGYRHPQRDVRQRIIRALLDAYQQQEEQQEADEQASQSLDQERQ